MTTQNSLFHAMYASYKLHIKVTALKSCQDRLTIRRSFPGLCGRGRLRKREQRHQLHLLYGSGIKTHGLIQQATIFLTID